MMRSSPRRVARPSPFMRSHLASLILCASVTSGACGGDDAGIDALASDVTGDPGGDGIRIECVPGEQLPCICGDGLDGLQICLASGAELSACACEDPTSDASSGADSSSTTQNTGGSSEVSSGSGPEPVGICLDGALDEAEQCDDGNRVDDDACSNDCIARCGAQWVASDLSVSGVAVTVSAVDSGTQRLVTVGRHLRGAARGAGYLGVTASSDGAFVSSRVLEFDNPLWQAIAIAGDGSVGLVGLEGADAVVAVLDPEGREIWRDSLDDLDDPRPTALVFDAAGAPVVAVSDAAGVGLRKFGGAGETLWTQPLGLAARVAALELDPANTVRALTRGDDAGRVSPIAIESIDGAGLVGERVDLGAMPSAGLLVGMTRVARDRWYVGLNLSATVFELIDVEANQVERNAVRSDTLGLARSEASLLGFGRADDGLVLALHHREDNLVSIVRTGEDRAVVCERSMAREDEPPALPTAASVDGDGYVFIAGAAEGEPLRPWVARFR